MEFSPKYQGKVMRGTGAIYEILSGNVFAGVSTEGYERTVVLTGYSVYSAKGNLHYQTTGGQWIFLSEDWREVGVVSIAQYSQANAQALVNKIIKNNKKIICNNLLCARYANKLTEEQRSQVRELQNRLQSRNSSLQAGGLCSGIKTSYPAGYAELSAYLDALMSGETIGVATWVVVVIAATVIAATATAAYFAYKSIADESERDVKFSDDLTRTLTSKLTEEEYQQLLAETKGIVTKARIKQALSSYGNIFLILGIGVGSALLYRWLKNRM